MSNCTCISNTKIRIRMFGVQWNYAVNEKTTPEILNRLNTNDVYELFLFLNKS